MTMRILTQIRRSGFSLVEAVLTIAIIGIMSALAVSAISNGSVDASRILARQQQAAIQEALFAWVMSQSRVTVNGVETSQLRSIASIQSDYNTLATTDVARFALIAGTAAKNYEDGFLDQSLVGHIYKNTIGSGPLKTDALIMSSQHIVLPNWTTGGQPSVQIVNAGN
jgi:prepilin-type N-terminal cleavage/methylation domain-containing protein